MPQTSDAELQSLRSRIAGIDRSILDLVAERMELARQIGDRKIARSMPVKDYRIEKEVLERNLAAAQAAGVYPELARDLTKVLIRYAVAAQDEHHQRARRAAAASARRILILGGRGHMGLWLSDFFDSFGHGVSHFDPGPAREARYPLTENLQQALRNADVVVLSTPISVTATALDAITASGTGALVFDICSLKSPLLDSIERARLAGIRICSVHPMFGPGVSMLTGRNIIICDCGDAAAADAARALFAATTANLLRIPLERHDRLMGYVLNLSHLVNLMFAGVLADSGLPMAELAEAASTTFTAQLAVAAPVTRENRDLYYEIQAGNAFSPALYRQVADVTRRLGDLVCNGDREGFCRFMDEARAFFDPAPT